MPSTQSPAQPSSSNFSVSVSVSVSSSSRRLLSQPEFEHPVNLLLGVVLHRLEEEGRLQKSDLAIRVEEFRAAGRRERVQQGPSSSRPTSSYQDNGSIDSKATIRLMDILRTAHQTPASPTSSRSSLWGRPNQPSLSDLVPEVFGAYHAYDDGFKRPWILMERPRGQVLSDLLSSKNRSAQTLQDRLQLARALARLQAAIWAVSPAPSTCPDSTRAAIPPLSLGRPFVPRAEEGLVGSGRSRSKGIHTSSSSFAYSCIRESPPGTPASSSHGDDGGRSPPAPSSPTRCPLTTRIVAGLRLQQTMCEKSWQGITEVARLDDLIEAAETLLSDGDDDTDVENENGLGFDSSIKGWEREVGRQRYSGTVPEYVLSLPLLGADNIFIEEVPNWNPNVFSSPTTSRRSSYLPPLTPDLPTGPFAASPPSRSWTVTGLSELDVACSEPAPLAFLAAVSSNSIWAQILLALPVEPDFGPSRPLTNWSWNELEMEQQRQQQQQPTKKKEQPKEPKRQKEKQQQKQQPRATKRQHRNQKGEASSSSAAENPSSSVQNVPSASATGRSSPRQQAPVISQGRRSGTAEKKKMQQQQQRGGIRRRNRTEVPSSDATTPSAAAPSSRQRPPAVSHGHPASTAEKKTKQQQQQGNKRRRFRKEVPDATTPSAAATATSSSQQQAHNESDDESDVGFEFEPEDDRKRKRSWASSSSSLYPFNPTAHPSAPPHHHQTQDQPQNNPLLQAFYAELAQLVPHFDRTCKRALANKLPELLRLAGVDRFGEADGDGDGARVGGGEERRRDEEVVLAAAKDRLRRREERAAAAGRVTGLSILSLSSSIPLRNAS
ncbi:unnamed protein product [Tilletia controversa]|nr:unnamed protein product [Tilletia controversa]